MKILEFSKIEIQAQLFFFQTRKSFSKSVNAFRFYSRFKIVQCFLDDPVFSISVDISQVYNKHG